MRKIPATMATQHPDHAGKPFFQKQEFIPTIKEAEECFLCYSALGIDEYKWDWEGKLVDEAVLERLLADHYDFFKQNSLGKEKFLTFRLPNPKVQTEFRLSRALMGILSSSGLAKAMNVHTPPLFEVILPMTETAEEMIDIQEAFAEIAGLKHKLNRLDSGTLKHIEIIPLFEDVKTIINSNEILEQYLRLHKWKFGFVPKYMRPYVARSDPALNSGLVPTMIAIKIALSRYNVLAKKHHIQLFPVVGVGALPFRGSLTPLSVSDFVKEYKGIRTTIIQSAFRYDFPLEKVKAAIKKLNLELPRGRAAQIDSLDEEKLIAIIPHFEKPYQKTIEGLAELINKVAKEIPKRRERVQHIGLFGYSRGLGKVKLPRAISFTASLYSLGVPPELIGTGRGLLASGKDLKLVGRTYLGLKKDLGLAGRFLSKSALVLWAKNHPVFKDILEDVLAIEKILKIKLGPKTAQEKQHAKLSVKIFEKLQKHQAIGKTIHEQALLRKSMG